ncbi:MAG: GNAT family N-acetyltransferase [Lachnospiraceae bacterium]|nr:GNAT family N-acetyltransferase [Lachnospiraceae bacterium]
MEIRRAEVKDIPRVEALLYQVHEVHRQGRPDLFLPGAKKYTSEELTELFTKEQKERPVFVAVENDTVLGYCFCIFEHPAHENEVNITTLYIDDLCVDETLRGKHIGKALYDYVVAFAKEQKCYRITLNVWECNPTARAFYDSMGLSPLKTVLEQIL